MWEITSAKYPSGATSSDEDREYNDLLCDGWEPFSVNDAGNYFRVWFRRQR